MVDQLQSKRYDVNLIYTGSYDSISSFELKRDPVKKPVFELAKRVSQCLSDDLGADRVYYPERDMLGGVNFFDEFDRVIDGSFVTLLLLSKDIGNNHWFKWLNHSAVKREKDKVGLNTLFLAAPGMTREDILQYRCEFVLVDNVIYVGREPTSVDDIRRAPWYKKVKDSILFFSGRTTTNRQISEQAQNPGTMASRPSHVIQSEEEAAAMNSVDQESPGPEVEIRNPSGQRGDISPARARAERRIDEPNYPAPQEATDPPPEGIDAVLPGVKDQKPGPTGSGRTAPRQPSAGDTPRQPSAGDTPRQPSSGDTPRQPSAGDTPRLASTGDTPRQPSSGDTPRQPSAGDTPRLASTGDSPSKQDPSNGSEESSKWGLTWGYYVAAIAVVATMIFVWRRNR